jgi:hypothetical protein
MAPPERPSEEESALASCRSGATIGVDVTVSVTTSPEMVTTRVLVTGDGVADMGMEELEVDVVGTGVDEVVGSGVELVLDVVVGAADD